MNLIKNTWKQSECLFVSAKRMKWKVENAQEWSLVPAEYLDWYFESAFVRERVCVCENLYFSFNFFIAYLLDGKQFGGKPIESGQHTGGCRTSGRKLKATE